MLRTSCMGCAMSATTWRVIMCSNGFRPARSRRRSKRWVAMLWLASVLQIRAQEITLNFSNLLQGAQQWAQENLDTNTLNNLPTQNRQQLEQVMQELQQRFQGEYVINLGALRESL